MTMSRESLLELTERDHLYLQLCPQSFMVLGVQLVSAQHVLFPNSSNTASWQWASGYDAVPTPLVSVLDVKGFTVN